MERTLKKHQVQTQLNEKLRLLVEKEGLKGDKPGWVFKHTTLLDEEKNCLYLSGGEKWLNGKIVNNKDSYSFDLGTKVWSRNK